MAGHLAHPETPDSRTPLSCSWVDESTRECRVETDLFSFRFRERTTETSTNRLHAGLSLRAVESLTDHPPDLQHNTGANGVPALVATTLVGVTYAYTASETNARRVSSIRQRNGAWVAVLDDARVTVAVSRLLVLLADNTVRVE